jgi:hypothetical protein
VRVRGSCCFLASPVPAARHVQPPRNLHAVAPSLPAPGVDSGRPRTRPSVPRGCAQAEDEAPLPAPPTQWDEPPPQGMPRNVPSAIVGRGDGEIDHHVEEMSEPLPAGRPAVEAGPGGAVRFAVFAADGSRSGTWRVWTSRRQLDVYITARSMARSWKVSLHQSGSWQHGFVSAEQAATAGRPRDRRHLDIWPRPADFAPGAWRGLSLWIPHDELRQWPPGSVEHGSVVAVPSAGPAHAAALEFVFMTGDHAVRLEFAEPVFLVARLTRPDNSVVAVVARRVPWPLEEQQWLQRQKATILSNLEFAELERAACPRLILMGSEPDGTRRVLEAAVEDSVD